MKLLLLTGSISKDDVAAIVRENNHPSIPMDGAIIRANCFDGDLIESMARQTNTRYPLFVAWRALNALLNNELNAEEKKEESDRTTFLDIVNPGLPYHAQLYLTEFPLTSTGKAEEQFTLPYQDLINVALRNKWTTDIQEDWLLLKAGKLSFSQQPADV